jgi:hypothetical protein
MTQKTPPPATPPELDAVEDYPLVSTHPDYQGWVIGIRYVGRPYRRWALAQKRLFLDERGRQESTPDADRYRAALLQLIAAAQGDDAAALLEALDFAAKALDREWAPPSDAFVLAQDDLIHTVLEATLAYARGPDGRELEGSAAVALLEWLDDGADVRAFDLAMARQVVTRVESFRPAGAGGQ